MVRAKTLMSKVAEADLESLKKKGFFRVEQDLSDATIRWIPNRDGEVFSGSFFKKQGYFRYYCGIPFSSKATSGEIANLVAQAFVESYRDEKGNDLLGKGSYGVANLERFIARIFEGDIPPSIKALLRTKKF